jgi:hypothetical protein
MKLASILAPLLLAGAAYAQPPQDHPRRGPPQEFVDACKGKKDGEVVEAKSPHGDMVKGVCRLMMMPSHPGAIQGKQKAPAR